MRYSQSYHSAVAIQRLVVTDAKNPECLPKERCLLTRAFVELETLKLRLRMKPAPKPVDTEKLDEQKRKAKAKASADKNFAEQ